MSPVRRVTASGRRSAGASSLLEMVVVAALMAVLLGSVAWIGTAGLRAGRSLENRLDVCQEALLLMKRISDDVLASRGLVTVTLPDAGEVPALQFKDGSLVSYASLPGGVVHRRQLSSKAQVVTGTVVAAHVSGLKLEMGVRGIAVSFAVGPDPAGGGTVRAAAPLELSTVLRPRGW